MKPALQQSAEVLGGGLVNVTIGRVQPHDSVEQLQLCTWTGSAPIPTGGGRPVACQDSWNLELSRMS